MDRHANSSRRRRKQRAGSCKGGSAGVQGRHGRSQCQAVWLYRWGHLRATGAARATMRQLHTTAATSALTLPCACACCVIASAGLKLHEYPLLTAAGTQHITAARTPTHHCCQNTTHDC